jgi:D-galacturonate reductase
VSFEKFIDAAAACSRGDAQPADFDAHLPTVSTTLMTTAILEAGRLSLDAKGAAVCIKYAADGDGTNPSAAHTPTAVELEA